MTVESVEIIGDKSERMERLPGRKKWPVCRAVAAVEVYKLSPVP